MLFQLKACADKKGLSLREVARRIGRHHSTVYSWTWGLGEPSFGDMDVICQALACDIFDLLQPEPVKMTQTHMDCAQGKVARKQNRKDKRYRNKGDSDVWIS